MKRTGISPGNTRSWLRVLPQFGLLVLVACGIGSKKMGSSSSMTEAVGVSDSSTTTQAQADAAAEKADESEPVARPEAESVDSVGIVQLESTAVSGAGVQTFKGEVSDSLVSLQVKGPALLESSLEACLGGVSLRLVPEMFSIYAFSSPGAALDFAAEGKVAFLSGDSEYLKNRVTPARVSGQASVPSTFTFVGDLPPKILELEAANLSDSAAGSREAAAADTLTDRYLRALEVVGQVAAHNCSLVTGSKCDCTTVEAAQSMLERCLPVVAMTAEKLNETAALMAQQCTTGANDADKKMNQRKVIAALVSSYAFAARR